MDFGCAAYCKFAEQCLGNLPPELIAQKENLLKERVAVEMKRYFKKDFKRIGHAGRVARYAEQIVREEGGDLAVVLSAAYLHDIGIPEAERKYGSAEAGYQEQEGPPVAREILSGLGAREELMDEVCDIIAHHHHPRGKETQNYRAVYDADTIANLEEARKREKIPAEELEATVEKDLMTQTGKAVARKVLLASE
jgi:HD superfamily phosphodiesterase